MAVVAALIAIVALLVARGEDEGEATTRSDRSGTDVPSAGTSPTSPAPSAPTTSTVVNLPPPSAAPTTIPPVLIGAQQYLEVSAQGREAVQQGVAACYDADPSRALSGLQIGKVNRQEILNGLSGVNIPGFQSLFVDMQRAMELSIEADDLYQEWVRSTGCSFGLESNFYKQQADATSGEATAAKRRFVDAWNPVARQYGLRQFSDEDI